MCANGWIKSRQSGQNMMTDNEMYMFRQLKQQLEFARNKIKTLQDENKKLSLIVDTLSSTSDDSVDQA